MFRRPHRAKPAPLLNERGQGVAALLFVIAGLFWLCLRIKGLA